MFTMHFLERIVKQKITGDIILHLRVSAFADLQISAQSQIVREQTARMVNQVQTREGRDIWRHNPAHVGRLRERQREQQ